MKSKRVADGDRVVFRATVFDDLDERRDYDVFLRLCLPGRRGKLGGSLLAGIVSHRIVFSARLELGGPISKVDRIVGLEVVVPDDGG